MQLMLSQMLRYLAEHVHIRVHCGFRQIFLVRLNPYLYAFVNKFELLPINAAFTEPNDMHF